MFEETVTAIASAGMILAMVLGYLNVKYNWKILDDLF